jgi:MarR family transcriptional regulator, transcriptional regulator for hemolysin
VQTQDSQPPYPLGYLIHDVARLLRRRFEEEARIHGITLPQWRALAQIAKTDGISQVGLAGLIDTDPMTLSGILDRLEKRGLVERIADPGDSRAKLARITTEGAQLVNIARNVGREMFENAQTGVAEKDRQTMIEALRCIRSNLTGQSTQFKELQE